MHSDFAEACRTLLAEMDAQRKELLQFDDSDSSLAQILARDNEDFEALLAYIEAVHTQLQDLPEKRRVFDSK